MDRVEEIQAAISNLPPEDYRRIVEWVHGREQQQWDEQMDCDSSMGRLDRLFVEADTELTSGIVREWPPRR